MSIFRVVEELRPPLFPRATVRNVLALLRSVGARGPRLGLEYHLNMAGARVDVLLPGDGDPAWYEYDDGEAPDRAAVFWTSHEHAALPRPVRRCIKAPAIHRVLAAVARAGGQLRGIGRMHRRTTSTRLHFAAPHASTVLAAARAARWPGDSSALARVLSPLGALADSFAIDFDVVRGRLLPSIGIELFVFDSARTGPRWRSLLDWFATMKLCSIGEATALLRWPRRESERRAGQAEQRFLGGRAASGTVIRALHHAKLGLDSTMTAKVYLGVLAT
jgi:hypothetical protein